MAENMGSVGGASGLHKATMLSVFNILITCVCGIQSVLPQPPHNLTLAHILSTAAIVRWEVIRTDPTIAQFEMTLLSIPSTTAQVIENEGSAILEGYRSTHKEASTSVQGTVTRFTISGGYRSHTLQNLSPDTEYQIYMVAINGEGMSNASSIVTFKTLPTTSEPEELVRVKPGEVLIVVMIVAAWICAIVLFLHKWGKIRIIQPSEPRYKHAPKNIDTIKVVKTPTESVIYRSYSKNFSRTMQAREKRRIERMNTMPNIKVSSHSDKNTAKTTPASKRVITKRQTMAHIPVAQKDAPALERLKEVEESVCDDSTDGGDCKSVETSFIRSSKA